MILWYKVRSRGGGYRGNKLRPSKILGAPHSIQSLSLTGHRNEGNNQFWPKLAWDRNIKKIAGPMSIFAENEQIIHFCDQWGMSFGLSEVRLASMWVTWYPLPLYKVF